MELASMVIGLTLFMTVVTVTVLVLVLPIEKSKEETFEQDTID